MVGSLAIALVNFGTSDSVSNKIQCTIFSYTVVFLKIG